MNGEEVAAVGRQAGFEGEALVLFLAVTKAESGWNPAAVNVAGNSPPSRDRGLVQINCVTPDTPVLLADLTWRPAGDLNEGDRLVAFEEEPTAAGVGVGRRFKTATVNATGRDQLPAIRVTTEQGDVVASTDHQWLVYSRKSYGRRWVWTKTKDLQVGDELCHFARPWVTDTSWESGWLAGMYDGEGSLTRNDASRYWMLSVGQVDGPVADRLADELRSRGFPARPVHQQRPMRQPFTHLRFGNRPEIMRFLGSIRPQRLLAKAEHGLWEDATVGWMTNRVAIERLESVGLQEIVPLATSTGTVITNGFLTHNSYWHPEVSDACAFDPACAARECWRISSHGQHWSPWSAYNNGSYKRHLSEAEGIVAGHFSVSARNSVLEIARSQLGVEENPPHSNHVPFWDWYGPPGQGNPWCACFVSWCFAQAGIPLNISTTKGFVYVPSGVDWFRSHGQLRSVPEPGFIALYRAHTGIVESVMGDGSFTAIEGNEGDQVTRVHRTMHDSVGVIGFGDPLYTDDEGEPEMTEAEWGRMTELVRTVALDVVRKEGISGAADPANPAAQKIITHGDATWRKT